jgi:hypothetical protein
VIINNFMCMYTSITSNFQIRLLHLKYIRLRTAHTLHSLNGQTMRVIITAINLRAEAATHVAESVSLARAFLAERRVLMKSNDSPTLGFASTFWRCRPAVGSTMKENEFR